MRKGKMIKVEWAELVSGENHVESFQEAFVTRVEGGYEIRHHPTDTGYFFWSDGILFYSKEEG